MGRMWNYRFTACPRDTDWSGIGQSASADRPIRNKLSAGKLTARTDSPVSSDEIGRRLSVAATACMGGLYEWLCSHGLTTLDRALSCTRD